MYFVGHTHSLRRYTQRGCAQTYAEVSAEYTYQFLQCFLLTIVFGRSKHRICANGEQVRKTRGFGVQNRAWGRPSGPKSSPDGQVQATKRASHSKKMKPQNAYEKPQDCRTSTSIVENTPQCSKIPIFSAYILSDKKTILGLRKNS